ncbi:NAD(P)-binding rossmann-like domain-containing protein [Sarocladium implicatum]|nr:NAD(P)-binding rossmann-like domain-containing protein [Sarocladium implicatum]
MRLRSSGPAGGPKPDNATDQAHVEDHDILILGAGLSGINAAHFLRLKLPHRSFTVLEARHRVGGTWNFFRYPGFRSDSSMSSFGFQWHPWPHSTRVGAADQIAAYLEDAVDKEPGLRDRIRLNHRVVGADWSSERERWRLEVVVDDEKTVVMDAKFIIGCTGYYDYQKPLEVEIPGLENFEGEIVHPQFWPDALDVTSKRIAVIGSGATAVTIVPQLVKTAAHVTQVQRSPSYVAGIETRSKLEGFLSLFLPLAWVHYFCWWQNTIFELFLTEFVLAFPTIARYAVRKDAKKKLPPKVDVDVHFNPSYAPMTQRLCLTPGGEFFDSFHRDNCDIVTDTIDTVTKDSVVLHSGQKIPADIIVTATGLRFHLFGGVIPTVDGKPVIVGDEFCWRGCMICHLPNMAFTMGYVVTTWTPGSDQMAKIVCKLLAHMEKKGATVAVPWMDPEKEATEERKPPVAISSGYIVKAHDRMPKVTGKGPWYGRENLAKDMWALWFGDLDDGMKFSGFEKESNKTA